MERLSHLFESSAKIVDLPKDFRAAQFISQGGKLEIKTIPWIEPKEGEVVVKVSSCSLHTIDQIAKYGLLPHLKYPLTPGSNVTGEIVQLGHGVKGLKAGHQVVGIAAHGGLAEYAVLNADYVVELKKEGPTQQSFVDLFDGSRVEAELKKFEQEEKNLSRDETRRHTNANERLGYEGGGIRVVVGDGAPARIATQMLLHCSSHKDERVLLITPNDNWNHSFYGIEEGFHLKFSHNDLGSALKAIGGIRFAVAVSQPPQAGFEQILEAMRYGSELVLLAPHFEHKLQLPLTPIVSKSLSIRGASWPDRASIEKVLDLVHQHVVQVSTDRYKFSNEGVVQAFAALENGSNFNAPVVVVRETIQAAETQ